MLSKTSQMTGCAQGTTKNKKSPDKLKNKIKGASQHTCKGGGDNVAEPTVPTATNLNCLLLEDTSDNCAPVHLRTLLSHYDCNTLGQAELLFLLVYIIALESGYICKDIYEISQKHIAQIPPVYAYHSKNVINLCQLKPVFNITKDKTRFSMGLITLVDAEPMSIDLLFSLLTACVSGELIIITLSPANSIASVGYSIAISTSRYVINSYSEDHPVYYRFKKLGELTFLLRNNLFAPMRNKQFDLLEDIPIYPSLDAMPVELYDYFFQYLNKKDLKNLAKVNHNLRSIIKESKYFKMLKESSVQRVAYFADSSFDSNSNSVLYILH